MSVRVRVIGGPAQGTVTVTVDELPQKPANRFSGRQLELGPMLRGGAPARLEWLNGGHPATVVRAANVAEAAEPLADQTPLDHSRRGRRVSS